MWVICTRRTAYDRRFISVGVLTTIILISCHIFLGNRVLSGTEIQHPLFIEAQIKENMCYRLTIIYYKLCLKLHYVSVIVIANKVMNEKKSIATSSVNYRYIFISALELSFSFLPKIKFYFKFEKYTLV